MPNLPFELIEDILRRLPVKTLKRFRAVAKSWCALIDSQNFIKLHYRQSLISSAHLNLIIGGLGVYNVHMETLDKAHVIKPPFYYKSVDGISNSCNGIVLVMSDPPVLWNIYSREYRVLPDCSTELEPPFESYGKTAYGFGYDSVNDDYKVIRIAEFRHKMSHIWMASETKIYGLKSNSWRRIEDFPYPLPFLKGNWRVHVNGALHTLVEDSDAALIMAFNVRTEKHTPIMMPPGIRIRGIDVSLDMIDGCLSVVCTSRYRVVIWVMKEYGVRESWFKLLTISPPLIERNDFVRPLAYSKDRKMVLLNCDDKRLVWYDLGKKSVEEIDVEGLPFVFYAEVCVETLITLNGGVEVKRKVQSKAKKKEMIRGKSIPLPSLYSSSRCDSWTVGDVAFHASVSWIWWLRQNLIYIVLHPEDAEGLGLTGKGSLISSVKWLCPWYLELEGSCCGYRIRSRPARLYIHIYIYILEEVVGGGHMQCQLSTSLYEEVEDIIQK